MNRNHKKVKKYKNIKDAGHKLKTLLLILLLLTICLNLIKKVKNIKDKGLFFGKISQQSSSKK